MARQDGYVRVLCGKVWRGEVWQAWQARSVEERSGMVPYGLFGWDLVRQAKKERRYLWSTNSNQDHT